MSHCTICGRDAEGYPREHTAACREVNRIAALLQAAWAKAEPEHGVTKHPVSYVATFVDMAKAIVADQEAAARAAFVRHGLRVVDIAWQAYQSGAEHIADSSFDEQREGFRAWWTSRRDRSCAMPTCEKCGHEAST